MRRIGGPYVFNPLRDPLQHQIKVRGKLRQRLRIQRQRRLRSVRASRTRRTSPRSKRTLCMRDVAEIFGRDIGLLWLLCVRLLCVLLLLRVLLLLWVRLLVVMGMMAVMAVMGALAHGVEPVGIGESTRCRCGCGARCEFEDGAYRRKGGGCFEFCFWRGAYAGDGIVLQ
jgi:hypothetical protein